MASNRSTTSNESRRVEPISNENSRSESKEGTRAPAVQIPAAQAPVGLPPPAGATVDSKRSGEDSRLNSSSSRAGSGVPFSMWNHYYTNPTRPFNLHDSFRF